MLNRFIFESSFIWVMSHFITLSDFTATGNEKMFDPWQLWQALSRKWTVVLILRLYVYENKTLQLFITILPKYFHLKSHYIWFKTFNRTCRSNFGIWCIFSRCYGFTVFNNTATKNECSSCPYMQLQICLYYYPFPRFACVN